MPVLIFLRIGVTLNLSEGHLLPEELLRYSRGTVPAFIRAELCQASASASDSCQRKIPCVPTSFDTKTAR